MRPFDPYHLHSCPTCTCLTSEKIRERMRQMGHTCIWSSENKYNEKQGYLQLNCLVCEEEK